MLSSTRNHILKPLYILSNSNAIRKESTILAQKLVFSEYGEPSKVLRVENEKIDVINGDELVIKMLASPVNPADINTIQGAYSIKPKLPAVAGNEGVGEIVRVGTAVNTNKFKIADRVVPLKTASGTWRSHMVVSERQTYKIPKELGLVEAATFTVNPSTAYRMLKDFVKLNANDVVIQNGGNSACGQYVIQLCKAWGIKTINIVRNRPNIDELKKYLKNLGATYVLTEEELRTTDIFSTKAIDRPKLALNCVGGKSATEITRQLQQGGTMVTYGGMSREPITVPISALIFKDIRAVGFWMTRWTNEHEKSSERFKMLDDLVELMKTGRLHGPSYELVNFDDFKYAVENTLNKTGMSGKKYILEFK